MPAYNVASYIREAIDSVLAQTFADFEFIIVDDGSTDATSEIILSYADPRIRYFRHPANRGISAALTTALKHTRGDTIARMDADDSCLPERFATQLDYLDQHPEITLVGCFTIRMNESGEEIARDRLQVFKSWPALRRKFLRMSFIGHPCHMVRGDVLRKISYTSIHYEDYALLLQMINASREFYCIPQHLLRYRVRRGSIIEQDTQMKNVVRKMTLTKLEYLQSLSLRDRLKSFNIGLTVFLVMGLVYRAITDWKSVYILLSGRKSS